MRKSLLWIPLLMGPLFVGIFSVAGWLVYGGATRAPQQIEYVIPVGTEKIVAAGNAVPTLPDKWQFLVGDVLLLRNEDIVNHQFGPFWIPAGATITMPLERASKFSYLCSVHPNGSIQMEVLPPNYWTRVLYPILYLGFPIGGVFALSVYIASSLNASPDIAQNRSS